MILPETSLRSSKGLGLEQDVQPILGPVDINLKTDTCRLLTLNIQPKITGTFILIHVLRIQLVGRTLLGFNMLLKVNQ